MNTSLSILFLNCKSINCKLGEVKLLLYVEKQSVFCFQPSFNETWLKDKREPSFIGYESVWDNREDGYPGVIVATESPAC